MSLTIFWSAIFNHACNEIYLLQLMHIHINTNFVIGYIFGPTRLHRGTQSLYLPRKYSSGWGIPSDIDIHGYADDHGIKKSYQANDKLGEVYVKADLSQCRNDVNGWMNSNRLKLNNSKTEFAAFASGHHNGKVL